MFGSYSVITSPSECGEKKFVYRFQLSGQKKLVRNQIGNSTGSSKEIAQVYRCAVGQFILFIFLEEFLLSSCNLYAPNINNNKTSSQVSSTVSFPNEHEGGWFCGEC